MLVLAIVNAAVTLLVNPWRDDRPSERFPGIVQDVAVIAIFMVIATVLLREQLLTTSAVGAVVVGFALQDTLGNLFAGLAIQIEKPFRVGQWIQVGGREGQVQEITWRATKLRTKDGRVPDRSEQHGRRKSRCSNYSEPTVANSVDVEVGASYLTPPNEVKRAILEAIGERAARHARAGAEGAGQGLRRFGDRLHAHISGSTTTAMEREARDQVRTNLWYTFRRHNIEMPYPIQIQYERDEPPLQNGSAGAHAAAGRLAAVDLFASLSQEARHALALSGDEHLFAAGETIVRQGAAGDSMFVVLSGRVRVSIDPAGQEVAVIPAGGFFGEMSMLTGDARTATVKAIEDAVVLEISAADFRALAEANPALIDHVSTVVGTRRTGLEEARANAAAIAAPEAKQNFLARMRKFLTLHS